MKIVHLCLASFYIDNYSYQENLIPKYHREMGHDVVVIASLVTFDEQGRNCFLEHPGEYICKDGYKVIRVDYKPFLKPVNVIIRRYVNLFSLLEHEKPSVIFVHGCQFLDIRYVVKYVKKNPGVKVYVDNHADFINSGTNWLSKNILHKIIWRYCAQAIAPYTEKFYGVTPARCKFLTDVYNIPPAKIELLVLGADDAKIPFDSRLAVKEQIREKYNISADDFLLVTGGKINERKNIHLLMQAVAQLPKIKLLIFGNCTQEMAPVIAELGKADNIRYIGWIDPDKAYSYFLASDLIIFPGTHSVLWEQAVGCGIPCVFKYWVGMDHVDTGGNCRFLHDESVDGIKEVIIEITESEGVYDKMKAVAAGPGREDFLYTRISKKAIGC